MSALGAYFGPPNMVVGQLEQIDLHDRHDHRRPVPGVLVEIEQRA
jgi:hypothetical protein